MSDVVISVENVSKQYRLGLVGTGSISHDLNRWWARLRGKEDPTLLVGESNDRSIKGESAYVWALKDINFEVKQGEVLGIIGRNGAGKSTLLKILSRVTAPTIGQIKVKGRIASLLEVGTGFHPELTGRENIYLNGAINGMTKAEVTAKLDEIVEFSGCERYIDTPVKRYSSGMTVRLGFSVAAHLEPEILIVDEVLAVGDAEFQKKCIAKMQDVAGHGRTILFVSHNMAAVKSLCQTGYYLRNGTYADQGLVDDVVNNYLGYLSETAQDPFGDNPERGGSGEVRLTAAALLDESGQESGEILAGTKVSLLLAYRRSQSIERLSIALTVYNQHGVGVLSLNSDLRNTVLDLRSDKGSFVCEIPRLPLTVGNYRVAVALQSDGRRYDLMPNVLTFKVVGSVFFGNSHYSLPEFSVFMTDHEWSVKGTEKV